MSPRSYSNASVQLVTGLEALLATEGVLGPVYAPADIIALDIAPGMLATTMSAAQAALPATTLRRGLLA